MAVSEVISESFTTETERFIISVIQPEDRFDVFETMNSKKTADIITFLLWPMTLAQAEKWCKKAVDGINTQREFLFLVRSRNDKSPIGCISLHKVEEPDTLEVGYWVTESQQRKRCATEMLEAMIRVAFDVCGVARLIGVVAMENSASRGVLEKQGFQVIGTKELPTAKGKPLRCHVLELKRRYTEMGSKVGF